MLSDYKLYFDQSCLSVLSTGIGACFPGDSGGEESACNAGDLGSIPGFGRSSGEGNYVPLIFLFPLYFLYLVTINQFFFFLCL